MLSLPFRHVCEGELSLGDLKRQLIARAGSYKQLEMVAQSKQAEQISRVVHQTGEQIPKVTVSFSVLVRQCLQQGTKADISFVCHCIQGNLK